MFRRIKYQLYLFQLENYNVARYAVLVPKFFGREPEKFRQELVWTNKLKALAGLALLLHAAAAVLLGFASSLAIVLVRGFSAGIIFWILVPSILWFLLLSFIFFVFLIAAHTLLIPLDRYLKNSMIRKATAKVAGMPNLKVIGIAGSYGKTTMKEMVAAVLKRDYEVLQTPENINTPLGIATLVLEKLSSKTQVFVMEMGEHEPGDISDICRIAKPDFGIITGINEAHLERMGDIQRTIGTVFELAGTPGDSPILMNADDRLVRESYKEHIGQHKPLFYSSQGQKLSEYVSRNEKFHEDASGNSFQLVRGSEEIRDFKTRLLGRYSIGTAMAAAILGREFEVPIAHIQTAIAELPPVHHRLEPVPNRNGVTVIDDSYNGNPEGVREAIHVLAGFSGRRRIYITPGLVEMGARSDEIHYNIGKELASAADKVILVRNSVTPQIAAGLKAAGFPEESIVFFENALEAHAGLGNIVRAGDAVLFQNDWPDNYF